VKELEAFQLAGIHFAYLEYDECMICTCGLALHTAKYGIDGERFYSPDGPFIGIYDGFELLLDLIHRARGIDNYR
jgi:hypothetical protein